MIKSNTEIFGNFAKYLQQDFAPEHWEQMSVQFINHSSSNSSSIIFIFCLFLRSVILTIISVATNMGLLYIPGNEFHNWLAPFSPLSPKEKATIYLVSISMASHNHCLLFLLPTKDHISSHSIVSFPGFF